MNTQTARKIHNHVAYIAEIATTFSAQYGSNYRLTEQSPLEAVQMVEAFMMQQEAIAALLDPQALATPHLRWEAWWQSRDVMSIGLVNELASDVLRLIERVAWQESNGQTETQARSLLTIQETIAGLLHPAARTISDYALEVAG